jgi:hypothetical protein
MGMYLTGVHLMGVYFINVHLTSVHLMGLYLAVVDLSRSELQNTSFCVSCEVARRMHPPASITQPTAGGHVDRQLLTVFEAIPPASVDFVLLCHYRDSPSVSTRPSVFLLLP